MSNDQRGSSGRDKVFHCSFCGKSQHEVRKLIARVVEELKRKLEAEVKNAITGCASDPR